MPVQVFNWLNLKRYGLELSYPNLSAPENCMAYWVVTGHFVENIRGRKDFRLGHHIMMLKDGRADIIKCNNINSMWLLKYINGKLLPTKTHRIQRGRKTVTCISVYLSSTNKTNIKSQEWRDAFSLTQDWTSHIRGGGLSPTLSIIIGSSLLWIGRTSYMSGLLACREKNSHPWMNPLAHTSCAMQSVN